MSSNKWHEWVEYIATLFSLPNLLALLPQQATSIEQTTQSVHENARKVSRLFTCFLPVAKGVAPINLSAETVAWERLNMVIFETWLLPATNNEQRTAIVRKSTPRTT